MMRLEGDTDVAALVLDHCKFLLHATRLIVSPLLAFPDDISTAMRNTYRALAMSEHLPLSDDPHIVVSRATKRPYLDEVLVSSGLKNFVDEDFFHEGATRAVAYEIVLTLIILKHHRL
jgi:hypothetical protein